MLRVPKRIRPSEFSAWRSWKIEDRGMADYLYAPLGSPGLSIMETDLLPFTPAKTEEVRLFRGPSGSWEKCRASRNHEARSLAWDQAGPQACRLPSQDPFWFR